MTKKTKRLHVTVEPEIKNLIQAAAKEDKRSESDWIRQTCINAARKTLKLTR